MVNDTNHLFSKRLDNLQSLFKTLAEMKMTEITAENGDLINKMMGAREQLLYKYVNNDTYDRISITVSQTTPEMFLIKVYAMFGKKFETSEGSDGKYSDRVLFETKELNNIGDLVTQMGTSLIMYPEIPPNVPAATAREILARGGFGFYTPEGDGGKRKFIVISSSDTSPSDGISDVVPCRNVLYVGVCRLRLVVGD